MEAQAPVAMGMYGHIPRGRGATDTPDEPLRDDLQTNISIGIQGLDNLGVKFRE